MPDQPLARLRAQQCDASDPHPASTTFPVDDVAPAAQPVCTETLFTSLTWRFRRPILALPAPERAVTNNALPLINESAESDRPLLRGIPDTRLHPLIDAVHIAFSQHYPLTLSPDAVWLTIAQGFSHHLAANGEALRGRLVRHLGRRKLIARMLDLNLDNFERAIADLSAQIREATDLVLHESLICDFSTTTPEIRAASEVALMDTYASYFEYEMLCVCGIPHINITGSVEDWERIRARAEVLETYELAWWIDRLRPILDEFVLAAAGRPTREFWQAIYKPLKAYKDKLATGWITDLFPYLGDAPGRCTNWTLAAPRHDWSLSATGGGVSLSSFPSGLASVPVKVCFPDRPSIPVHLVAGFFAVEQHASDLALSPLISWSVTEPPPEKPVVVFE